MNLIQTHLKKYYNMRASERKLRKKCSIFNRSSIMLYTYRSVYKFIFDYKIKTNRGKEIAWLKRNKGLCIA